MKYEITVKERTFRFDTLAQALEVVGKIFHKTGIVVGIVEVLP